MDGVTIEKANLDNLENNFDNVAKELTSVADKVSSVNSQISSIDESVNNLTDEVTKLMNEIKETTIINNARQAIMYNNEQIEKKYGYFDILRRKTESLLDSFQHSKINRNGLIQLRENILLNNPNYWLANSLAALISWLIDDKYNCDIQINNSFRKNKEKTSSFFCLINLKFGRIETSIRWLNSYLNNQNPANLDGDFVTILDLISNDFFGNEGKKAIIDKLEVWFKRLNIDSTIDERETKKWENYITTKQSESVRLPYLDVFSPDAESLRNNLMITSSYRNLLLILQNIISQRNSKNNIDEIIKNLIYEYEENEQIYQMDNLKNSLILKNNGDIAKATKDFENEKHIYSEKNNLLSLMSNIIMYSDKYNVNDNTRKFCLGLIKNNILKAYANKNSQVYEGEINIAINDFSFSTTNGINNEEVDNSFKSYIKEKFIDKNKMIIIYLIIINIATIIACMLIRKNFYIFTLLIFVTIGIDAYFSYNIIQTQKKLNMSKEKTKHDYKLIIERVMAEIVDYKKMISDDKKDFEELKAFLNSINSTDFIRNNNQRNISIGE